MPRFCAMVSCANRADRDKKSFFRLPAELSKGITPKKNLSRIRRQRWLCAINRSDLTLTKLKYLWVCEDHFITGKPADLLDFDNPDWIPNLKLGYGKKAKTENVRRQRRARVKSSDELAPAIPTTVESSETLSSKDAHTQTTLTMHDLNEIHSLLSNWWAEQKNSNSELSIIAGELPWRIGNE